ncbi:MAG: DUF4968 domain-containing protein, partial [Bacteroidaceae bacterium]|nr:DUF4968 domain-containing protein [Bacteroidaceae bacterium]
MKRIFNILLLACLTMAARAENRPIEVQTSQGVTRLTFLSPSIVRVEHAIASDKNDEKSLVVTMKPMANLKINVKNSGTKTTAASRQMTLVVDK